MASIAVLIAFIPMRWRFVKGRGGWNPTLSFFTCTYIFFILDGVSFLFNGSWRLTVLPRPAEAPAIILLGVLIIAPFLSVILYGREKLFQVMARRFEDKRRNFDSAVIAQLMDNTDIRVGQEWWIHHGKNLADEYPGDFDHRRNWTRGIIVNIEGGRFAVDVAVEQLPLDIGKLQKSGNTGHGRRRGSQRGGTGSFFGRRSSTTPHTVDVGGGGGTSFFGGGKRGGGKSFFGRGKRGGEGSFVGGGGSFFGRGKVAPEKFPPVWFDLPSSAKLKAEDLLKNAMDNLRLVDGQYVTHGLMAK
jgi:hypothetical protein